MITMSNLESREICRLLKDQDIKNPGPTRIQRILLIVPASIFILGGSCGRYY